MTNHDEGLWIGNSVCVFQFRWLVKPQNAVAGETLAATAKLHNPNTKDDFSNVQKIDKNSLKMLIDML